MERGRAREAEAGTEERKRARNVPATRGGEMASERVPRVWNERSRATCRCARCTGREREREGGRGRGRERGGGERERER